MEAALVTDVIASTVRLLRERLTWTRGQRAVTVSGIAEPAPPSEDVQCIRQATSQGVASVWEVPAEQLQPKGSGTRLRAISMQHGGKVSEPELDRQFVCVPLADVETSEDLACVFSVNTMVFKCECEDPQAIEAGEYLASLMQDLIDVADDIDRLSQRALCSLVYAVVSELRRVGFAVAVGQGTLDVWAAEPPPSPALKSWQVLCVVLRDVHKAMPVALVPTPMNIA